MALVLTALRGLPIIEEGDDLTGMVLLALNREGIELADGDILVLAQKIVSKAEGRRISLQSVKPSLEAIELAEQTEKDARLVELILRESAKVLRVRASLIIVEHRLGFICANAGIDHSNVQAGEGDPMAWVLLLPENPDRSAEKLRRDLERASGAKVGVMIIDSHGRAWRMGTTGAAIGLAGMPGLVDLRGTPDLFGYSLRVTQVGAADELAAGASLVMGQAAEGTPVVHVRGFPYALREGSLDELIRPEDQDLFR